MYACKTCILEEAAERTRRLKAGDPKALAKIGTRHVRRLANRTGLPEEEVRAREESGLFFCGTCEEWKARQYFYPNRAPSSPTGVRPECRACVAERQRREAAELAREAAARQLAAGQGLLPMKGPAAVQGVIFDPEADTPEAGGGADDAKAEDPKTDADDSGDSDAPDVDGDGEKV